MKTILKLREMEKQYIYECVCIHTKCICMCVCGYYVTDDVDDSPLHCCLKAG